MTHIARRPMLTAAALMMLLPSAGQAQAEDRALANGLRECRRMADADARTACYDAIPLDEPAQKTTAEQTPVARLPQRAGAGFGANQLPAPPSAASLEPERISARVDRAVERQPGIYLLTLEDSSEWQFVDSAPASYDPPRPGSTVEISKASLGSYLLRYAGQRAVRARRVR